VRLPAGRCAIVSLVIRGIVAASSLVQQGFPLQIRLDDRVASV